MTEYRYPDRYYLLASNASKRVFRRHSRTFSATSFNARAAFFGVPGIVTEPELYPVRMGRKSCFWCDSAFTEAQRAAVDHIWPLSKGGWNIALNMVAACKSCNSSKGSRSKGRAVHWPHCRRKQARCAFTISSMPLSACISMSPRTTPRSLKRFIRFICRLLMLATMFE
jgi:5-methylcytosine-specific restriction endonuclease McrA